jgi:glycosyltransferase involved in cell wall biosynthesis
MRLCLTMIIKDEAYIIERCLKSALPYISCWAITDTGSSDETVEIVKKTLKHHPGRLSSFPFTNFSEVRNAAFDEAHQLDFDYHLLLDADHQLVANDFTWHTNLSHDAYLLLERSGGYSHRNVRLVKKGVKAHYVGATHEYLNVEGDVWAIDEAFIIDNADGSNRVGKLKRDRDILERECRRFPSHRNIYYLAQTYRDLGNYTAAADLYKQRAKADDTEEGWRAHLEYARCLIELKKDSKFVHEMLRAHARRPDRAEPLNDLARFFIDEKQPEAAYIFAFKALQLPKPSKELSVVDDWIYDYGAEESFYVLGTSFNDHRRLKASVICDSLSIRKNLPKNSLTGARNNLYYYCEQINTILSSWQQKRLSFSPPAGYNQMNLSVTRMNGKMLAMERTISYRVDGQGNYYCPEGQHSRNFLLSVDDNLDATLVCEIHTPIDFPPPQSNSSLGWEDLRIFEWQGELWTIGCVVEQNPIGAAEQYLARVNPSSGYLDNWRKLTPMATPFRHEKNWMPVSNGDLRFVYSCDPVKVFSWDANKLLQENKTRISADHFRGGSQLIKFERGYLAIIHSTSSINKVSWYHHRFVTFDKDLNLTDISVPFIFQPGNEDKRAYQYAMGLCWHPDEEHLVVSYQTDECRSWLGSFKAGDLNGIMRKI